MNWANIVPSEQLFAYPCSIKEYLLTSTLIAHQEHLCDHKPATAEITDSSYDSLLN